MFLLLSGLTLLWDFYQKLPDEAVLSLPFFGGWLAVVPAAQSLAMLVLSRALGAVSCLYFLSLSTPLPELLAVLRRVHVPAIMVELAVLIYRYIFILLATFREMKDSAASPAGIPGTETEPAHHRDGIRWPAGQQFSPGRRPVLMPWRAAAIPGRLPFSLKKSG